MPSVGNIWKVHVYFVGFVDLSSHLIDKSIPENNCIVVDAAFKLLIDNIDDVDKLFKLLNIVVDVLFKLVIYNLELVKKLFKLLNIVVDVVFKLSIENIDRQKGTNIDEKATL